MKKEIFTKGIFKYILFGLSVITIASCEKKSIDPGDWDVLPPPVVVEPDPDPVDKKTITLKVMSYNARLGNVADLTKMIDIIKEYNPDLLLLRQVDSSTTRANKVDRAKEVALATGMTPYFAKAFDYQTGGYGNAVLSRFPILNSKAITFSGASEVRSLAMITVKIDDLNKVVFAGTELDPVATNETVRLEQITKILNETKDIQDPVILAGNFNFNKGGEGFSNITNTGVFNQITGQFTFGCITPGCALNSPVAAPTGIFDFVTYKPSNRFSVVNYSAFSKATSGFLPIIAELELTLTE